MGKLQLIILCLAKLSLRIDYGGLWELRRACLFLLIGRIEIWEDITEEVLFESLGSKRVGRSPGLGWLWDTEEALGYEGPMDWHQFGKPRMPR